MQSFSTYAQSQSRRRCTLPRSAVLRLLCLLSGCITWPPAATAPPPPTASLRVIERDLSEGASGVPTDRARP